MEQRKTIIGIDVSKKTLDIFVKVLDVHLQISNNSEGFKKLLAVLKASKLKLEDCFLILEYTGGYEYRLIQFCQSKQISYVRISGLAIKRSRGLVRGKNDKIDARRIAEHGDEKQSKLKELADARVTKALNAIRIVGNLAGYEPTQAQRDKVFNALKSALEGAYNAWTRHERGDAWQRCADQAMRFRWVRRIRPFHRRPIPTQVLR